MNLTERISKVAKGGTDDGDRASSLMGAPVHRKVESPDASREIKVKVHNRLFETIDISPWKRLNRP